MSCSPMRWVLAAALWLGVAVGGSALAAAEGARFLEVRRDAWLYEAPSRDSRPLRKISVRDSDGPYLVMIVGAKQRGYYRVRLPDSALEGWIYKSLVRGQPTTAGAFHRVYRRSLYRHWIDEDGDCQDTRTEVLVRDSEPEAVKYRGPNRCGVARGRWTDPYSGGTFGEPRGLDVDHVVPLKNAHESGAWRWSSARRRQYANFLEDDKHLLAVKASENRRKGDKGPDRYLPPNTAFRCEYVAVWLRIKQEWGLAVAAAEKTAIDEVKASCP